MENYYSSTIESATATERGPGRVSVRGEGRLSIWSISEIFTTTTTTPKTAMDLANFDGDEAAEFLNGRMKQMLGDKYDKVSIIIIRFIW